MEEFLCQSCGSGYPTAGFHGTNADGSQSDDFCKYCWVNGEYGNPDETIEQMIESCVPYMVKSETNPDGYPDIGTARVEFKKKLLELKRWKVQIKIELELRKQLGSFLNLQVVLSS